MPISSSNINLRTGVCTSTTRPTTPYNGQVIYETDSKQTLVYNGSSWVMLTDADTPPAMQLVLSTAFSAQSSVNAQGCFSSAFLNYRAVVDISSGANGYLRMQMLSGTTPNTAGYSTTGLFTYLSAGTQYNDNIGTGAQGVDKAIVGVIGGAGGIGGTTIDFIAPYDSRATTGFFAGGGHTTNTGYQHASGGFIHYNGGSFDGFTLIAPSSMTGTIRVYGYRNAV